MNVTRPGKWVTDQHCFLWSAAEQAAHEVGIRLHNLRWSGKGIAFTLKTSGARPKYRRLDRRGERTIPGRVCWHGTRDFLRALFSRLPDAKVRTAMATYNGAADFERTYRETYDVRSEYMGYMMPAPIDQPCACRESRREL